MTQRFSGIFFILVSTLSCSFGQINIDSTKTIHEAQSIHEKLNFIVKEIGLAARQNNIASGDSLIIVGDQLIKNQSIKNQHHDLYIEYQLIKGEFYRADSKFKKALSLFQGTLKELQESDQDTLWIAESLLRIALTYERMSQYNLALKNVNKAYEKFKIILDTSDYKFCTIYNSMGNCYYRSNNISKAREYYLKSKNIAEEQNEKGRADLSIALTNLSSIARAEQDFKKAINYSEQSLKISRELEDASGIASNYYSLGVYHYYLGDYGRSNDYLESCLKIREQILRPNHYLFAGPLDVLGIVSEESRDYERALKYYNLSKANRLSNFESESMEVAFSNENIGLCHLTMNQLDSALIYIEKANKILVKKFNKPAYSLATNYFSYAQILFLTSNLLEAKRQVQNSSKIYSALNLQTSSEYAQNIVLEAKISFEYNEFEKADELYNQALNMISQVQGGIREFYLTPNTLQILDDYLIYLFDLYELKRDDKMLEDFEKYSIIYLELSENFRKQFNDPYTKSLLIKNNTEVYQRNVGIYYLLYSRTNKKSYLEAAFGFSEYGRSAMLRDMQNENIQSYAGVPDSVLYQEKEIKREITRINNELIENPEIDSLRNRLFLVKEKLDIFIKTSLKLYPNYYQLKYANSVTNLNESQSKMREGENIIEFVESDTAYYALVFNKTESNFKYIGNKKYINNKIQEWRNKMNELDLTMCLKLGKELYNALWEPIDLLIEGEKCTVIPSGALFYLSFESLNKEESKNSFLIYKYNISYASSCNTLFREQDKDELTNGKLLSIAPGFEDEIKIRYTEQLDSLSVSDDAFLKTVRQPWSMRLVKSLANNSNALILTGLSANEGRTKENLPLGRILHFATHAEMNEIDPLRSRLVLAKDLGLQVEDGYLHAYEIYDIPLSSRLAILGACETGIGKSKQGEGMISIAYSFNYAGCPSTGMSLWKVDEITNTEITKAFLRNLKDGQYMSDALRNAKLQFLKMSKSAYHHPFYWAGMILNGNDERVLIEGGNQSNIYWFFMVSICLLFILFVFTKGKKKRSSFRKTASLYYSFFISKLKQ